MRDVVAWGDVDIIKDIIIQKIVPLFWFYCGHIVLKLEQP